MAAVSFSDTNVAVRRRSAARCVLTISGELFRLARKGFGLSALLIMVAVLAGCAGSIASPHVAQATDFGRLADGSCFLVLEYVAGRTLRATYGGDHG